MADVVSKEARSVMMSGIRSKNTQNEKSIRSLLFIHGYRFRIHAKSLPGKPDIVLKKYRTLIFIHGCFWHMHSCHLFKTPKTRTTWWKEKLFRNKQNDDKVIKILIENWRVIIIRECAIKGKNRISAEKIFQKIESFLKSKKKFTEIKGISE